MPSLENYDGFNEDMQSLGEIGDKVAQYMTEGMLITAAQYGGREFAEHIREIAKQEDTPWPSPQSLEEVVAVHPDAGDQIWFWAKHAQEIDHHNQRIEAFNHPFRKFGKSILQGIQTFNLFPSRKR